MTKLLTECALGLILREPKSPIFYMFVIESLRERCRNFPCEILHCDKRVPLVKGPNFLLKKFSFWTAKQQWKKTVRGVCKINDAIPLNGGIVKGRNMFTSAPYNGNKSLSFYSQISHHFIHTYIRIIIFKGDSLSCLLLIFPGSLIQ